VSEGVFVHLCVRSFVRSSVRSFLRSFVRSFLSLFVRRSFVRCSFDLRLTDSRAVHERALPRRIWVCHVVLCIVDSPS